MARLNLALALPGLVLFICGAGCNRQVDLSPDGKTIVMTNGNSVEFRESGAKKPSLSIKLDGAGSPSFSPDGKLVAIGQSTPESAHLAGRPNPPKPPDKTFILDSKGTILFSVKGVGGPYAWRPDGTELAGSHGKSAVVIHLPSHQIVRTYPLPEVPSKAKWLGGRDVAFGSGNWLTIVHKGVPRTRKLTMDLWAIGFDLARERVVWVEAHNRSRTPTDLPKLDLSVTASDLSISDATVIVQRADAAKFLGADGRIVLPTSASISPDGTQLAVAGVADDSEPGVIEKLFALSHKQNSAPGNQLSGNEEKQLRELEKQMKLLAVCGTTSLTGVNQATVRRITRPGRETPWISAHWTGDGKLAMLLEDEMVVAK